MEFSSNLILIIFRENKANQIIFKKDAGIVGCFAANEACDFNEVCDWIDACEGVELHFDVVDGNCPRANEVDMYFEPR